jgi:vesicle-associated membrane protein 7
LVHVALPNGFLFNPQPHGPAEKVLERGERIDILVDKTDNLNQASFAFKKRSTALRRAMWWKNQKLMYSLGGVGFLVLYLCATFACGFPAFQYCT